MAAAPRRNGLKRKTTLATSEKQFEIYSSTQYVTGPSADCGIATNDRYRLTATTVVKSVTDPGVGKRAEDV